MSSPAMADAVPEAPRPVGLILNGMAMSEPGLLVVQGGNLFTRVEDLRQLGIEAFTAPVLPIEGQDYVELGHIAGLSAELDDERTNLKISASPEVFPHLAFGQGNARATLSPILPAQFLGYDLVLSSQGGGVGLSGLVDLGMSGQWGVLGTTMLLAGRGGHAVRLDTSFRREFPQRRLRIGLGDAVSRPGPGGQPIRFGGIQFGTDFSLDPDSINFPLPVLLASAALPSTVELLSEAQRQSYEVGPGSFDIALQPRMTGAGQVTMNIRDVTGQTRTIVRDFYTSTDLLRPGLTDFTVEAGALRRNYGVAGADYGAFFAAAAIRRPLSSWFTAQARAETAGGTSVIGIGGSFVVGALAEVNSSGALSFADGHRGHDLRVQARRTTSAYSLSASFETASKDFQSPGQAPSQTGERREMTLAASLPLGRWGGLNLAQALLDSGRNTPSARRFSITSASYNTSLWGGALGGGVQRSIRRGGGQARTDWSVFASYTLAIGPQTRVAQFAESGRAAATFDRSLPDGPGWGLRALVGQDRGRPWLEGAYMVRTAAGDFGIDAARRGSFSGIRATASGALVRVAGTVLATPRLDYAFALIDVDSDDTVTVTLENRPLPRKAGAGRKVIATGLQPYAANHIGIDGSNVSIDSALASTDAVATPGWRQAAAVHFGDSSRHPASFRIMDGTGHPIPVGAIARWSGGTGVVGYDGEVWMEDHTPGEAMIISMGHRQCRSIVPSGGAGGAESPGRTMACEPYIEAEDVL
ncbi:fimbria/pilus outer membrane usher protein [Novosphingobium cyanobacteriorum]|uniref:Fimbria/pilus outer membrane usher protein n=1 Tax=Novosphingobium cyanobacteriorum TaxID=3024215 RepID=A0ABT6CFN9_9SPHN|nr:fimbria/pilus outer membrane usher protein [Novosphingobium cyanobacteriorum]MDF8332744.1 fimbria/pilus outer membrane usher protein [Novosphingobium cyanobacteriorum]